MSDKIFVVGIDGVTAFGAGAMAAFEASLEIIVSPGLMELAASHEEFARFSGKCVTIPKIGEILRHLRHTSNAVTVLASGDPLYFGIGTRIADEFSERAAIIPALSSVQIACARLRMTWHDAMLVSLHGPTERQWKIADLTLLLKAHGRLIILTGGINTAQLIAGSLPQEAAVHVFERLGYPDEAHISGEPARIAEMQFRTPNIMIVTAAPSNAPAFGLGEAEFRRQRGLITKDEVRAVVLHRLALPRHGVMWDIGSGSGSVAIEARRMCHGLEVYAVEKDPARADDIRHNALMLGSVNVIEGMAPEALTALPDPDRVFIGGSGGGLRQIISELSARMRQGGIVVISAITLESINEALTVLDEHGFGVDVASVSISRSEPVDGKTYLKALNTVTVIRGRA